MKGKLKVKNTKIGARFVVYTPKFLLEENNEIINKGTITLLR